MESNIKQNVMNRVRTIHTVRPFTSGTAVALFLIVLSLYAIGRFIFVAQVFRNMPSPADIGAFLNFFVVAFMHTDFIVQVLSVLVVASLIWVARDVVRSIHSLQAT